MKRSDYKCEKCGKIRTIMIQDMKAPFPEEIPCYECESFAKRVFTPLPSVVYQGKCGNFKNGYESSPVSIKKS